VAVLLLSCAVEHWMLVMLLVVDSEHGRIFTVYPYPVLVWQCLRMKEKVERLIRFAVVGLISHSLKYEIIPSKGFGSS